MTNHTTVASHVGMRRVAADLRAKGHDFAACEAFGHALTAAHAARHWLDTEIAEINAELSRSAAAARCPFTEDSPAAASRAVVLAIAHDIDGGTYPQATWARVAACAGLDFAVQWHVERMPPAAQWGAVELVARTLGLACPPPPDTSDAHDPPPDIARDLLREFATESSDEVREALALALDEVTNLLTEATVDEVRAAIADVRTVADEADRAARSILDSAPTLWPAESA